MTKEAVCVLKAGCRDSKVWGVVEPQDGRGPGPGNMHGIKPSQLTPMSAKSKSVLGEALGMFLYVKSANITSVSWTIKHKIKFLTSLEFELLRGVISWGPYKYFENQMEKDITDVKFKDVISPNSSNTCHQHKGHREPYKIFAKEHPDYSSMVNKGVNSQNFGHRRCLWVPGTIESSKKT